MGETYGPTFGAGDVIGVGLDNASNNIFFTKNGRYLGTTTYGLPKQTDF
jgi:hypothetical protein